MDKNELQKQLIVNSITASIHHAYLQVTVTGNGYLSHAITRGLIRLELKKKFGICVTNIKRQAELEVKSGEYEAAAATVEQYSRGTQTVVFEVMRMVEQLESL